jgi:glycosyltransferase involved in cell wall biosynthesis
MVLQANILSEHELSVLVVETGASGQPEPGAFCSAVRRLAAPDLQLSTRRAHSLAARWKQHYTFEKLLKEVIRSYRPQVVLAYDIDSMVALTAWVPSRNPHIVFDFSELPDPRAAPSLFRHWKIRRAHHLAGLADLVIHPDPYRAAIFQAYSNVRVDTVIVPNCPRRVRELQHSSFRAALEAELGGNVKIVAYVGGIDPSRGLLAVVESMPLWPSDAALVCRGLVFPDFARRLERRAAELGVGRRIIIKEAKAYDHDAISVSDLATADIGLDLREPRSLNDTYAAFATNKLHQYMAAGIPVIARNGPGYVELVHLAQTGICVDMTSPREIADAVNTILNDRELQLHYGFNGRRLHLTWLNYDRQFAPVLDRILQWCNHNNE